MIGLASLEEKKRHQRSPSPPMGRRLSADQEVSSPESEWTGTLILDFPALKTLRNAYPLCKHPVCDALVWHPELTD